MAGIFLIDKPAGPTSFAMVQKVRRALGVRKVGHAGTLDPFATGLLVVCVGRPATRMIQELMVGRKTYQATLQLGVTTDTQDLEGTVVARRPVPEVRRAELAGLLAEFVGEQLQTPPAFSALKHQGKPLYHYARQGIVVAREPRPIVIHALELLSLDQGAGTMSIQVACGKGTYIRTLAADLGEALGCGAHLIALRRLGSGPFSVAEALDGSRLAEPAEARRLLLANHHSIEEVAARLAGAA